MTKLITTLSFCFLTIIGFSQTQKKAEISSHKEIITEEIHANKKRVATQPVNRTGAKQIKLERSEDKLSNRLALINQQIIEIENKIATTNNTQAIPELTEKLNSLKIGKTELAERLNSLKSNKTELTNKPNPSKL